ncbi:MAG: adenylate cyclase [Gammaproteobacteria bacterium]|jgi:adenylate cyclase
MKYLKIVLYFKSYGFRILMGLVLTVIFGLHVTRFVEIPFLNNIEQLAYDLRLNLTAPGGVDERIVIVDVDEQSLQEEGRWPWSRAKIANLVDNLFDHYQVDVTGFDIVFAEPERREAFEQLRGIIHKSEESELAKYIEKLGPHPDQKLADSLQGKNVVLGYYFNYDRENQTTAGMLPEPLLPAEIVEMLGIDAPLATGYGANLELLQSNAKAGGFFDNPLNDSDGVFRRIPLIQQYNGALYSSLALMISEIHLDSFVEFDDENDRLLIGDGKIPVDNDLAALIPYRGPQGSFVYVSATDVLNKTVPREVLENRIVLVGTTAPGLFDLRNTPVQKIYPGVEIHANIIAGVLDNRFNSHPGYTLALELFQIVLLGLLLSFVLPAMGPTRGTILVLLLLTVIIGVNAWLWVSARSVMPVTSTLLLVVLHYMYVMSYGFLIESRTKKALMVQFGRYVPQEIVDEMSEHDDNYSVEGERRNLTVLFSDIRGFTGISEQLEPRDVVLLMNLYLSHMTELIHTKKGTIDKYIGDAIMAFWGAPIHNAQHASDAIATALLMQERLNDIQQEFKQRGWPEIRMGIGINSGLMAVGNMGSDFRMAYTVMGDPVNVGSRVESLTKVYGVKIIVTENTKEQAVDFRYRLIDRVRVRNRLEPLSIFEPIGLEDQIPPKLEEEVASFEKFLDLYLNRQWAESNEALKNLIEEYGEKPLFSLYFKRIEYLLENPPDADWDGVFGFADQQKQIL